MSAGSQALLAGDLLVMVAGDLGYRANTCPDGAAIVEGQVRSLLAGVDHLAAELTGVHDGSDHAEPPSPDELRAAAVACTRRSANDDAAVRGAMAVVIAGEWVQNLARTDLEQPVEAAVAAARVHWWR